MPFPHPPVLRPVTNPDGPPPCLPRQFRAVALMQPYRGGTAAHPPEGRGQIAVAEVVYDHSVAAMRVTVHPLEGRPVDLLFVGAEVYAIDTLATGGLRFLGPLATDTPVPPTDWLSGRAMNCQGQGGLVGVACDWWVGYTPNANGLSPTDPQPPGGAEVLVCNWVWTRSDTGLPFRLFFNNADNPYRLPVLGSYAMTWFTEFAPVAETALPSLVQMARRDATPWPDGVAMPAPGQGMDDLAEALCAAVPGWMAQAPDNGASRLVAGLKPAPPGAPLPVWSQRLCITGFTLPTAKSAMFDAAALPIRVFYAAEPSRMLTRAALQADKFEGVRVMDMILHPGMTHLVEREPDGRHKCLGTKPVGPPYPDWAARDGGQPRAVIVDNPVLGPGRTIVVSALPSTQGRWFWVWYTPDHDGILFAEVPQKGNVGLVVTDYDVFDHDPPPFPDDAFDVPPDCLEQGATATSGGRGA